ncbi:TerC family protein [Cohnella hashimotonis]|uniref:TerC family protein n=1 Tax=Cohnella hashimotonis TaxID=2826895 RepID=A0ABT6TJW6_9BACL|nr:TerC family protein [Cohnella hashimotonis]MDI4646585.1 TerC family protein [Cohnella hashimotonis]
MDFLNAEFFTALITIVLIDLMLAGDNAIVIGLAARNLPKASQKKAILWGTAGAVIIRVIATLLIVYLLKIPFLLAVGGVVLIWIAYKLLVQEESHEHVEAGSNLWSAVRTIVIADAAMGLDNVIAVAGAASGSNSSDHSTLLVILGLLISIPIVVWGSTLFVNLITRFPWIIYIGSAILAYTAAKMITHEKKFEELFDNAPTNWAFIIVIVIAVLVLGIWSNAAKNRKNNARKLNSPNTP